MTLSPRQARWLLCTTAFFTLPVAYYLGELESAPAARLGFLSALIAGVALTEGNAGFQGVFVWLGLGQLLLWSGVLLAGSALVVRVLPERARGGGVALLCVALLVGSSFTIYSTPISSRADRSNLAGILD